MRACASFEHTHTHIRGFDVTMVVAVLIILKKKNNHATTRLIDSFHFFVLLLDLERTTKKAFRLVALIIAMLERESRKDQSPRGVPPPQLMRCNTGSHSPINLSTDQNDERLFGNTVLLLVGSWSSG